MKSYTNQKDKIGKFLIAVCIILAGIIFFQYMMILADYEGYDGKAQAVIQNIEMQHVYAKAVSYEEYRIFYTYTVDGQKYSTQSEWITTSSDLRIGGTISIRYDTADPENVVLTMEKDNATGMIFGMVLTAVIIIGIKLFANYRNKNYR
jgi:hypothetical protein